MAARVVRRLPARRRTAASELERWDGTDAVAPERTRRRVRADRRAEIPCVNRTEPTAEHHHVLLHEAARPECRAVVVARQVRGPLQLFVFRWRTTGIRGDHRRGEIDRQEGVSLYQ